MKKVAILDNIRSCHNVGAILRTADGAGFDTIFLCGYTPAPPDKRINKVSLGAEDFVNWQKRENIIELILELKDKGLQILALEKTQKSKNILTGNWPQENFALILGNEVSGVSNEVLDLCDQHLEIPMHGEKESLNVSVAAGIAFYQF